MNQSIPTQCQSGAWYAILLTERSVYVLEVGFESAVGDHHIIHTGSDEEGSSLAKHVMPSET